jgi:hypothetical protein
MFYWEALYMRNIQNEIKIYHDHYEQRKRQKMINIGSTSDHLQFMPQINVLYFSNLSNVYYRYVK